MITAIFIYTSSFLPQLLRRAALSAAKAAAYNPCGQGRAFIRRPTKRIITLHAKIARKTPGPERPPEKRTLRAARKKENTIAGA